jgi:hypothetical protein
MEHPYDVQKENQSVATPAALEPTTSNVSIEPGRSVNLTRHIIDLADPIQFQITQQANSAGDTSMSGQPTLLSGIMSGQPFNTTLQMAIKDPNGKIVVRNSTLEIQRHRHLSLLLNLIL